MLKSLSLSKRHLVLVTLLVQINHPPLPSLAFFTPLLVVEATQTKLPLFSPRPAPPTSNHPGRLPRGLLLPQPLPPSSRASKVGEDEAVAEGIVRREVDVVLDGQSVRPFGVERRREECSDVVRVEAEVEALWVGGTSTDRERKRGREKAGDGKREEGKV
ncbi:hypothetical protein BDY24DRAFT_391571 [Mrakia frigida]|uniref:uncharacterized protein n=1 Tax=Mrakia frigida TaxID=29902 RepID=UPI003FCC260D